MRFAVYVGGTENGFDTPGGGEGRYAYNVAQVLAHYGHDVDCIGSAGAAHMPPTWGRQQPIERINFVNEFHVDPSVVYEAYLNAPFECRDYNRQTKMALPHYMRCIDYDVNAKVYVHFMFSWNLNIEANTAPCWKDHNHIIAYPYDTNEYESKEAPIRLLPSPVVKDFAPLNPETRNSMVWACKNVFTDDWPSDRDWHPEGTTMLKAMAKVSNKLDVHCYFISSGCFSDNRARRFEVPETIATIKNKTMFPGLIYKSELDALLLKSRVVPILPAYSGSFLDSFGAGAVPVFYSDFGSTFPLFFSPKNRLFNLGMSVDDMSDVLERFFVDDDFYIDMITSSRKDMSLYTFENCYKYILDITEEFC